MRALLSNPLYGGWNSYRHERIKACDRSDIEQLSRATKGAEKGTATAGWRACEHDWVRCTNVPSIIAPERWETAQHVRRQRAKPHVGGRSNRAAPDRFLLSGLLTCSRCSERLGSVTRKSGNHVYKCRERSTSVDPCDLPILRAAEVDDAVRESFVRQFVDVLDVEATLERERVRLEAKQHDATRAGVQARLVELRAELEDARALGRTLDDDYAGGDLRAATYDRLSEGVERRVEVARAKIDRLTAQLDDAGMSARQVDALVESLASLRRMIRGHLTATDVPRLNAQPTEVFRYMVVEVQGDRMTLDPVLTEAFHPPGTGRTVDFSDPNERPTPGIEVVEFLEPVLQRVDLIDRKLIYSS